MKRLSTQVTKSDAVEVHCLKIVDYLTEQYCAAKAFVIADSSSDEIVVAIYDRQDPPFCSTRRSVSLESLGNRVPTRRSVLDRG
jgi:hypothetical protein